MAITVPHPGCKSWIAVALRAAALLALASISLCAVPASASSIPPRSELVGSLTLASAQWEGHDLIMRFREGVSFTIPGDAGYMVYERNDGSGVRHLCVSSYNKLGLAFELLIDVFQLDGAPVTPIDILGRSILSAGRRAVTVNSEGIELAGLSGFDVTMQGVPYDRQAPMTDMRAVFLTNLRTGILFTLVERQHRPAEHVEALDSILATLSLAADDGGNA
ncbi:MAG: hypothetical protein KA002_01605 [Firmicutes bacterium]|jgi:hypothetical protein|nr:hypothetical protein [Bacillota bacterium]